MIANVIQIHFSRYHLYDTFFCSLLRCSCVIQYTPFRCLNQTNILSSHYGAKKYFFCLILEGKHIISILLFRIKLFKSHIIFNISVYFFSSLIQLKLKKKPEYLYNTRFTSMVVVWKTRSMHKWTTHKKWQTINNETNKFCWDFV